jgi:hypothetical protein
MIENSTLKLGGNSLLIRLGELLEKLGKNISNRHKPILVTNPSAKFINPFTLLVNFTIDSSKKYQVILQGDFKEKYKEFKEMDSLNLTEEELFKIIRDSKKDWFKKE